MFQLLNKCSKHILLLIFFLIIGGISFAQNDAFFKVTSDSITGLPSFYAKKNKLASIRINTYLDFSVLKQLRANLPDSVPQERWVYRVYANNKQYLTFSIAKLEEELDNSIQNYCFNSSTGEIIGIQDIFTPNGIAFIKKNNLKSSLAEIKAQNLPYSAEQIKRSLKFDFQNFTISEDTLLIYNTKAFEKDSLGKSSDYYSKIGFSTRIMSAYLSAYGQAMFRVNKRLKMKKMASNQLQGLYQGKLDGEPILMQFNAPFDKELDGTLYFPRTKSSIPLKGIYKSNRFETSIDLGKLNISISSGRIQGTLKGINKKISYLNLVKV